MPMNKAGCEQRVIKALQSQTRTLSLNNSNLQALPAALGRLTFLTSLSAKNNALRTLPEQIALLSSLCYLNLGCNELEDCGLPHLQFLTHLTTLHLFNNQLQSLPQQLFGSLHHLRLLNLNNNRISSLPPQISLLLSLEQLSLSNNLLTQLPAEIGGLVELQELHVDGNRLSLLPQALGQLGRLKKLLLHKNQLRYLPSNLGNCRRLGELDVSCNKLEVFPSRLGELRLTAFHYESNPLLPCIPVAAQQQEEVLQLKELVSRHIIRELKNNELLLRQLEQHYPDVQRVLTNAGSCALCGQPFLHSWLQCVQFRPVKEVLPRLVSVPCSTHLPLKAPLCSYKCFNKEGHNFYGIAA